MKGRGGGQENNNNTNSANIVDINFDLRCLHRKKKGGMGALWGNSGSIVPSYAGPALYL